MPACNKVADLGAAVAFNPTLHDLIFLPPTGAVTTVYATLRYRRTNTPDEEHILF